MTKKFLYMLAPIEDMTDASFRSVCKGADLTFTELTLMDALAKENASSMKRIKLYDSTPTQIQLMGYNENSLNKFLSKFSPAKGFKGFNLNLGCPAPNFVSKGLGCAMIKRVSKVKKIIDIIKDYSYSASIKMRLGLNQFEKSKKVYLNLINNVDADFFAVHARHGKETYQNKADWSVFPECVKTGKSIIANGDIKTIQDAEKLSFCDGVMIGRAAVSNPLIFLQLKGLPSQSIEQLKEEYIKLAQQRQSSERNVKNILKFIEKKSIV